MSAPAPAPAAPATKTNPIVTAVRTMALKEAAKLEASGWNYVKLHAVIAITFVCGVIVGALLF